MGYLRLRVWMQYPVAISPMPMKPSIAENRSTASKACNCIYRPAPMRCNSPSIRSLSKRIASNSARMAFMACSSARTACIAA